MATLTISVEVSADGTYLTLKDLTPLSEYTAEIIDIPSDIISVDYTLTDSDANDYTIDLLSVFETEVRASSGTIIRTDDLTDPYGATFFADGQYESTLEVVSTGPVTSTGVSDDIFISQILQIVTSQVIDADWKELYNPYNNRLSSDLRKRLLIIAIIYSVQAGLLANAESQRLTLNKLCAYEP